MYANPVLFPQVTNRETWDPIVLISDDDTGDPIDLSALTFQVEIRRAGTGAGHFATPLDPYYDDQPNTPILSTAGGTITVKVLDIGYFQILVAETQMRTLRPMTYAVACTVSDGTTSRQIFLGRLPVLDGGVTN